MAFRKSLIVQLGFFSAIFFLAVFGYGFAIPYLEISREQLGTVESARIQVESALTAAIRGGESEIELLPKSELIQRIAESNPDFRYYIETATGITQSFGGAPYFQSNAALRAPYDLGGEFVLSDDDKTVGACKHASEALTYIGEAPGGGYAYMSNCPVDGYYFEISGITNVSEFRRQLLPGFRQFFSHAFGRYALYGGGIVLIALFLGYQAWSSLRNLSDVSKSIDIDARKAIIDIDQLPLEVRPVIRSVNQLFGRIAKAQDKQDFFIATAAHELKTPLTVVRGRLAALDESETKDKLKRDVSRMSDLVEQLLDLSRLKGMSQIELSSVDLVAIARQTCAQHAPVAIEANVELELATEQDQISVRADPTTASAALSNLISNALSYSKPGDKVTVSVKHDGTVYVSDQGPGIPDEVRETILEPFAKYPPNRRGHGLGLAIAREVMSLNGGEVSILDSSQQGATLGLQFNLC